MNSKRPSIITTRPKRPQIKKPKAKPRARPKGKKPSSPLGTCLLCGESVTGPAAIRLQHGAVRRRKWGTQFIPLPFDDQTKVKWICPGCALDSYAMADEGFNFSSHLKHLSADGWCCLCQQSIEPYPLEEWSSAILIERGFSEPSGKGDFSIFKPKESGHLHYFCMDDLGIELWRLIERTDMPDYKDWLSQCG